MPKPHNKSEKSRIEHEFLIHLQENGLLDQTSHRRVVTALSSSAQTVQTILLELGLLEERKLAEELATFLGLELLRTDQMSLEAVTESQTSPDFLRRTLLLPVSLGLYEVVIATANPLNKASAEALAYSLGRKPKLVVALASELNKFLSESFEQATVDTDEIQLTEISSNDIDRLRDIASEAPVIRLLNRLIGSAVDRNASDIHIELLEDHIRVRYRIDGALQVVEQLDRSLQLGLVSRIKILARLNIAEQRLPQDGRIRLAVKGRDIDLRVATTPTLYGENVVLRILDRKGMALDLVSLGFSANAVQQLKRILSAPNGVVLVTGPTGSGKTTTLYAVLMGLNVPQSKLFTVEDPIEYHLKGVNQIPVRPLIGLDFASVLRSVLRQDPDVIMVGEIRDSETAKIAVQAALTGHLVLSTLHTNSAAASITRLRHMGIENFLITSSVRAIVAQRLVRKTCECRNRTDQGNKCRVCNDTHYSGRTVIYEILELSAAIQKAILDNASDSEIESIARKDGMLTLAEIGQEKVTGGETSVAELTRAIGFTQP